MKSNFKSYLSSMDSHQLGERSCWSISFSKDSKGKGFYVFEFNSQRLYFQHFSSLSDFLVSNGFN